MPLSTGDLKKIYPIQNPHKHIYIRKGELQKKEQQKQSRKNEQKLHNNRIKKIEKKNENKTLTASRLILNYTRYTLYLLYSVVSSAYTNMCTCIGHIVVE